jgi:hypothetical protein
LVSQEGFCRKRAGGEVTCAMGNLHRILWIDAQIRQKRYPNVQQIADRFEISVRQAGRDLAYLKDTLLAPVEYSHQHRGYRYTDETFALPAVVVTEEERQALLHLQRQYQEMREERAAQIAGVLARLTEPGKGTADAAGQSEPVMSLVPQVAFVRLEAPEWAERLKLPVEAVGDGVFRVEYEEEGTLLRALWSCPGGWRIERPHWLRQKVCFRLRKIWEHHERRT